MRARSGRGVDGRLRLDQTDRGLVSPIGTLRRPFPEKRPTDCPPANGLATPAPALPHYGSLLRDDWIVSPASPSPPQCRAQALTAIELRAAIVSADDRSAVGSPRGDILASRLPRPACALPQRARRLRELVKLAARKPSKCRSLQRVAASGSAPLGLNNRSRSRKAICGRIVTADEQRQGGTWTCRQHGRTCRCSLPRRCIHAGSSCSGRARRSPTSSTSTPGS